MKFLEAVGGRKQLNGYIYTVLVTGYALLVWPDFKVYAGALAIGLGISGALIAWEDIKRRLAS
jgi:hypothetical protein